MTGRERILKALNHDIPDRVPVWIHAINEISIAKIGKLLFEDVPDPKAADQMRLCALLVELHSSWRESGELFGYGQCGARIW